MGKSKRTSGKNILETLAAELWVKDVNKVFQSRYSDSNGVALAGEDHRRKESQFQVVVTKAKIEQLMKGKAGNDEERDNSSDCSNEDMSELVKSTKITFLKEVANDEHPENVKVKDYVRAITAGIDPNYKEKTMAMAGTWSGYFGDQETCDEESFEYHSLMPLIGVDE
jgi:hypothetical protein